MVPSSHESVALADRGSAATHVLRATVKELVVNRSVDPEKLKLKIEESMSQVGEIPSTVGQKVSEAWGIQSVSVGLSINAEGSVGITTVGVETSLEVTFTTQKKTEDLGF